MSHREFVDDAPTNTASGGQGPQIQRFLDTVGDGSGTKNAVGNYVSPTSFLIRPPRGSAFRINRVLITIEDGQGMRAERYGALAVALTNGILVRVRDDSSIINDITDGIPVKTNAGWATNCFDVDVKAWGPGNELLTARWTFGKSGQMIRLVGDRNERLEVVCHDNMTGLVAHYFKINGYIEF